MKKRLLFLMMVTALGCSKTGNFPNHDITLIVPVSPGGTSDFVSRTVAASAEKYLGRKINVVNKPGGSASIGLGATAMAKPDGYTIGYAPNDISLLQYLGYADITPEKYESIMLAVTQPAALSVQADSPYKTIPDLISAAKKNPDKIVIANAGAGSLWNMSAVAFQKAADVSFKHVPFDGSIPALVALLGGHVDAALTGPSEALTYVQAGKLRLLTVMDQERFAILKEVPTLKEQGYDLAIMGWGGFVAPKGTPPEIVKTLHDAFKKAFDEPSVKEAYQRRGLGYTYMSGPDFEKFAKEQVRFFEPLVTGLGFKK